MLSAIDARNLLRDADAQREALRAAVEREALPRLREAWERDPGRIAEGALFSRYMRVGLVERRTDSRGTFDLVWLDALVYRPFAETPDMVFQDVSGRWVLTLAPTFGSPSRPLTEGVGPVWYRETGKFLSNAGYWAPWVHCGVNQRAGLQEEGRVDHLVPEDEIEVAVFPAAVAWLEANGGPVVHP